MNRRLSPNWTLAILSGLNLFNYLDRFVLPAVLPPLQRELQINDADAGRITSQFILGYFLSSPVFGYLGDRFSRKWLIAAGIFIWSLGTVLTGMAHNYGTLLWCRVLVGFGEASYATVSPSLISDLFGGERRNKALTIFYVAIPAGAALGNVIGGHIAEHYSWRHAFVWAGAPGLLLALILLPFREPERGKIDSAGGHPAQKPRLGDVVRLFCLPKYIMVVLGYAAYTFVGGAFLAWSSTFFQRIHGMGLSEADNYFGAMVVVTGLAGTFIGGWLASAWHKRHPTGYAWTLGLSVLAAAPFSLAALSVQDRVLSQACLAMAMFFLFFCTGPVNTVILEVVPANLHASAMAVSIFMIHLLGDWRSPAIIGYWSDQWGLDRAMLRLLPPMLLLSGLLWLALVPMMRAKKLEGSGE